MERSRRHKQVLRHEFDLGWPGSRRPLRNGHVTDVTVILGWEIHWEIIRKIFHTTVNPRGGTVSVLALQIKINTAPIMMFTSFGLRAMEALHVRMA